MEKLTVEVPPETVCVRSAACPKGHSLMDLEFEMNGAPAIRVRVNSGVESGVLHLNPWYGNFESQCTFELEEGAVYEFVCPDCAIGLRSEEDRCMFCGAVMFALHLPGGGLVQACSRKGCHNHKLRVVDLSAQIAALYVDDLKPRF